LGRRVTRNVRLQNNMKKSSIIYQETRILTAKYYHPKSDDYLDYISEIRIKNSGKNPVEMDLKFDCILPFVAPMPPKEHTIKAPAMLDLYSKVSRWFKKYGYEIK
jgi:hypothetical protein